MPKLNPGRLLALAAGVTLLVAPASGTPTAMTSSAASPLPFITMWGSVGAGEGQVQDALKLTVAPSGDVYVAELGNNRIQQFNSTGVFIRTWAIDSPWGIAAASDGSVYVCTDFAIYKYSASGSYHYSWGSFGGLNGQFAHVQDVAVDGDGNVYAADLANHRIQKFTSTGVFLRAWGMQGAGAGLPIGVTVGGDGYVYVTDAGNSTIQKFTRDGHFVTAWVLPDGIPGEGNRLGRPAVDDAGNAYVPDKFAHRIVVHDSEGTVQASWGTYGTAPGQFETPTCAALDKNGHLYVMDYWNYRVQEFGYLATAVVEERAVPLVPVLEQPVPSPMRTGMRIRFTIPREGPAELLVFDVHGRVVAHLLEGRQNPGWRDLVWDGRGESGRPVPSGVYFLRLISGHSVCRRFVVLR